MASLRIVISLAVSCSLLHLAVADYDAKFCNYFTSWAANKNYKTPPFFFDDFSVLGESAFVRVENVSDSIVSQEKFFYSKATQQAVIFGDKTDERFWAFIDQKSQDCIYKRNDDPCTAEEGSCVETAKEIDIGSQQDGSIELKPPSEAMGYPTEGVKKMVKFRNTQVRNINASRIGICSYREDTDETLVTIMYLLRPEVYPNMDQTQNKVLTVTEHIKKPGQKTSSFRRNDFTEYTQLTPSQLTKGFQLGEGRCGAVRSAFTSRQPPQPSVRFSYLTQTLVANGTRARDLVVEEHEYNEYSRISMVQATVEGDGQMEKDTGIIVNDYNGKISYGYSETTGECRPMALIDRVYTTHQLNPQQLWEMDGGSPIYEGVYWNRDIPCDLYRFDGPNADIESTNLYLANSDWLKANGFAENTFLPVELINRGEPNRFNEIYTFKDNPGYHIPYLPGCFQNNDILLAEVTLMINYYNLIGNDFAHFEYEFRTLIQTITGIKSPIRIALITPMPSKYNPDTETVVIFEITGKLTGFDDLSDYIYTPDFVTTQIAAERITRQVDAGNIKFTLDNQNIAIDFKKGSFATSVKGNNFSYVDGSSPGYSAGAMAGAAFGILVLFCLLGVAAVFGYKRYKDGAPGSLFVDMKSLQDDGSTTA